MSARPVSGCWCSRETDGMRRTGGERTIAVIGSGLDGAYPTEPACRIAGWGFLTTEQEMGEKPETSDFPRRNMIESGVSLETVVVEDGRATITCGNVVASRSRQESLDDILAGPPPPASDRHQRRPAGAVGPDDVVRGAPLGVDSIAGRSGTSAAEAMVCFLALECAHPVRQQVGKRFVRAEPQFSCRGLFSSPKVIFYDMFLIGNAVIDDPVAEAKFCCDVEACKGACCTLEGLRGAPLEDDEVAEVRRALPAIRRYLSQESLREIEAIGPVEGAPGEYATPCIGNRECVYVSFVGGIATCSFERAFLDGAITWRKPISCHLFPIRIRGFGQDYIRYEVIDECAPGRSRGEKEGTRLSDFLKNPLTRRFGPDWYRTFVEECQRQDGHRANQQSNNSGPC